MFNEYKIKDVIEEIIDYRGKTPKKLGGDWSEEKTEYMALSAKNIKKGRIVQPDTIRYVDQEMYNKWMKQEVERGTILITSEAPFGELLYWDSDDKIVLSQRLFGLKIKKEFNSRYIYYYMFSEQFQGELSGRATGSTVTGLRQPELLKCHLKFPNRKYQDIIANILMNIDKKIDLNSEINNNLFELMKRTYIEWFKNYNIPDMTFELKDSELGKIPCDWNVKHLKDVFFFQEGPGIRNWQYVEKDGTKFINIRCIKDNDLELDTANMISNEEADGKYKHFMLNEWDVVVSTSGTLGRNQIIRKEHLPLCLNTSVIRFKPINGFDEYAFMYNYLISDEFLNLLDVMATGSAQRNFGPMHLNKIDLVYPDKDIIKKFNDLIFPVIKNIQNNKAENMKLSQLRDTLLPKLMNGEIDLDNIEI